MGAMYGNELAEAIGYYQRQERDGLTSEQRAERAASQRQRETEISDCRKLIAHHHREIASLHQKLSALEGSPA